MWLTVNISVCGLLADGRSVTPDARFALDDLTDVLDWIDFVAPHKKNVNNLFAIFFRCANGRRANWINIVTMAVEPPFVVATKVLVEEVKATAADFCGKQLAIWWWQSRHAGGNKKLTRVAKSLVTQNLLNRGRSLKRKVGFRFEKGRFGARFCDAYLAAAKTGARVHDTPPIVSYGFFIAGRIRSFVPRFARIAILIFSSVRNDDN